MNYKRLHGLHGQSWLISRLNLHILLFFSCRTITFTRKCSRYSLGFVAEITSKVMKIKKCDYFLNSNDYVAEKHITNALIVTQRKDRKKNFLLENTFVAIIK